VQPFISPKATHSIKLSHVIRHRHRHPNGLRCASPCRALVLFGMLAPERTSLLRPLRFQSNGFSSCRPRFPRVLQVSHHQGGRRKFCFVWYSSLEAEFLYQHCLKDRYRDTVPLSSKVMRIIVFCMKFLSSRSGPKKFLSQMPAVVTELS
jgi:hypothetical protein